jgi:replicative DNA helicase
MLMDKDAIEVAAEIVTAEDFYNRQLGTLFEAMVELHREGSAVDVVTLQNRLREKNAPPQVSSVEFIGDLVNAVPTSANVKYYAKIVADKATLRKLIRVSEETINACYSGVDDMEGALNDVEKRVFQITQKRGAGDFVPIDQVVMNALNRIEIASKMKGNVTGHSTGFIDLDYDTAGFQPSDLILIAARPAMGKTAFVLNIAEHMAFHDNKCVAMFSLEMSKEQFVNRLLSMESHVDSQHIRTGNMTDLDWENLIESANVVGKSKLIIDDTPGITIQELRSKCRKYKNEFGLQIIIIDYLQLMSGGTGRASESRQQEISEISRSLKALARELNVPVVALSQLSRAVEQRPDHRPMLSDLRESGAIEQDADMVMFLYRDDYYNKDTEKKGIAEVIIAKQRHGPIGTVELLWLPQYTKFANLDKGH